VVKQACFGLERAGWIRGATKLAGPKGGRPSISYEINPKIKLRKEESAAGELQGLEAT